MEIEHKGWTIRAIRRPIVYPLLGCLAMVQRERDGMVSGFQMQGRSIADAVCKAKKECDRLNRIENNGRRPYRRKHEDLSRYRWTPEREQGELVAAQGHAL